MCNANAETPANIENEKPQSTHRKHGRAEEMSQQPTARHYLENAVLDGNQSGVQAEEGIWSIL